VRKAPAIAGLACESDARLEIGTLATHVRGEEPSDVEGTSLSPTVTDLARELRCLVGECDGLSSFETMPP
jgi:hypothetical protein